MRMLLVLMFACAFVAAASGCNKGKSAHGAAQTKKVGGCEIETIAIGTGIGSPNEAPADAAWIRVCSVDFAGNDVYRKAAEDLKAALGSHRVKIHSCTELTHVKEGSCWPPYSVEYRIELTEQAGGHLRTFLMQNAVANCRPVEERPEGYGTFFVSCGTGSSDWWAVWYVQ
jgi:hypothetical protein